MCVFGGGGGGDATRGSAYKIPFVVESAASVVDGSHWPGADLEVILTPRSGHSDEASLLPTLGC